MNFIGILILAFSSIRSVWAMESHDNYMNWTTHYDGQEANQSQVGITFASGREVSNKHTEHGIDGILPIKPQLSKNQMNINPSRPHFSMNESEEYQRLHRKWFHLMENRSSHQEIPAKWLEPTMGKHDFSYKNEEIKSNPILIKLKQLIQRNEKRVATPIQNTSTYGSRIPKISKTEFIGSKLENIKSKLKPKSEKAKTDGGHRKLPEFPGKNATARIILYRQWTTYYDCLQSRIIFNPQVHYVFQGGSVRMLCDVCDSPNGNPIITWHHSTIGTGNKEQEINAAGKTIAFSQNARITISENGRTLAIYGVRDIDAGNYTCSLFDQIVTPHLLQVPDKNENITKVWPETAPGKKHPAPNFDLPNFALLVWTKWKNWTDCSRCGWVGKRVRTGVCTVSAVKESQTAQAPAILNIFKNGLPCRSKLLPHMLQQHPKIAHRQSEIMESFCKVPCPVSGVYVVKDEKGNVVEKADNAAGVYSASQKLPRMPPPVQRTTVFYQQWDTAYILCPGSLHNDAPVRWFNDKKPIFNETDRVHVSPSHLLVINDLGVADTALYSCWQDTRLVGTVRLHVSVPVRLTFSQQISLLSMILVVGSFIVIFGRVFIKSFNKSHNK